MLGADVYDPFSLTQIIGYLAAVVGVFAFAQHDDMRMRGLLCLMGCIIVLHFVMLGAYAAAMAAGLAGSRAGLSMFSHFRRHRHIISIIYAVITIWMGASLYERFIDILPLFAALTGTYAFFYLDGIKMRLVLMCGTTFWLTHNLLALSYGPSVMEFLVLSSNVRTIYQMLKKKGPFKPL